MAWYQCYTTRSMLESDITTLAGFLDTIWILIREILKLNPAAFEVVLASPDVELLSLAILVLAELSMVIGQSVVLFANRIPRGRFIFSLMMSALGLVMGVIFWAFTIWALSAWLFDQQRPFTSVLLVVSLSQVPLLFGFLILLPYLGNIIHAVLRIWTLLALLTGVMVLFNYNLWTAIICTLLGWLSIELINRLQIIQTLERWLWRTITHTPKQRDTEEIVNEFVAGVRASALERQRGQ